MDNDAIQVVVFQLGADVYGVPIGQVKEIIRYLAPTQVPKSPEFVDGILNLRDHVLVVIDLAKRLGLSPQPPNEQSRIIIVDYQSALVGLTVDKVLEAKKIESSAFDTVQNLSAHVRQDFIDGIGRTDDDKMLIILNLNQILSKHDVDQLESLSDSTSIPPPPSPQPNT